MEIPFTYIQDIFIEGISKYPEDFRMESEADIGFVISQLFIADDSNFEIVDAIIGSISESFIQEGGRYSDIANISISAERFVVFDMKDESQVIYDISKVQISPETFETTVQSDFSQERSLESLYQENLSDYTLAWGSLQDHLFALEALFQKNAQEGIFSGNGYLDDSDIFDASSSQSLGIVNPELSTTFDEKSIFEIQDLARNEYRKLLELTYSGAFELLPETTQGAIRTSLDTYVKMVLGVGDTYQAGASAFHKSRTEIELGVSFVVNQFQTPEELMAYWQATRRSVTGNTFQDGVVENQSYPFYIGLLNRLSYQKMLDLGASREQLLAFAKIVSEREYYGPSSHDALFANIILGNLIGLPQNQKNQDNNDSQSEQIGEANSILGKLIRSNIMKDIEDPSIPDPEHLDRLAQRAQSMCEKIGWSYPYDICQQFLGGRSISLLSGKYSDLMLNDKFFISSLARFVSYIEQSIQENTHSENYDNALRENAWNTYIAAAGLINTSGGVTNLIYSKGEDDFELGLIGATGVQYVKIPISLAQDIPALIHYSQGLSQLIYQQKITFDETSQRWKNESGEILSDQALLELVGIYEYGTQEHGILPVPALKLDTGYIENTIIRSYSETFDQLTTDIMAKFDAWDTNGRENEYIQVDSLTEQEENGVALFSQTDIEILRVWTEINGLGELSALSSGTQDIMITGLKIALIMGLSIGLTLGTGAVAGAFGLLRMQTLLRGGTLTGEMLQGGVMGAYAAPISWVIYPHAYTSTEEMISDILSDLAVSSLTGIAGGSLVSHFTGPTTGIGRSLLLNGVDIGVLGLMTEAQRMKYMLETFHPEENFLDDQEITA